MNLLDFIETLDTFMTILKMTFELGMNLFSSMPMASSKQFFIRSISLTKLSH